MPVAINACAALRLSAAVTDPELFVLMASQRVTKRGRTLRVFCEDDLAKPSVAGALLPSGATVRDCLAGLARKGFLVPRGRRCFTAQRGENLVKHAFNTLEMELGLAAGGSIPPKTVARVAVLRVEMRRICAEATESGGRR